MNIVVRDDLVPSTALSSPPESDGRVDAQIDRATGLARWAVTAVFLLNGLVFGNWVPRIPAIQERLGLGEGALGVALLAVAVGALIAMPISGWAVARVGSRPVITLALLALCGALVLPALATGLPMLMAGLLVYGATTGGLDVAMNAQGVVVERRYGRPILSSFHAAFSLGGLFGAGIAGLMAERGVAPLPHFVAISVPSAIVAWFVTRRLLPARVDAGRGGAGPAFALPPRALLVMGVVAFCGLLAEGAIGDWSAVYLDNSLGAGPGLAAAGFAAFSLTMVIGRVLGDRIAAAWGPVALTRRGGILVAGALGLALVVGHPLAAVVGFAGAGAGLATVVPVVFSAAGRSPALPPGPAIAAVSTMGYAGFLVGPPAIGWIAEVTSLPLALGAVVAMGGLMALLAGSVEPRAAAAP